MANEFFAISLTLAGLAVITAAGESNLSLEPFPTTFTEAYEEVGVSGDGKPVELGTPTATWNFDVPLSNAQWGELMDLTGAAAYVVAYVRTRTNEVSGGKYIYKNYQCVAKRPTGNVNPGWRYDDVEMKFHRLVEV